MTIEQFLNSQDPEKLRTISIENVEMFAKVADSDEGKKTVKKMRETLRINTEKPEEAAQTSLTQEWFDEAGQEYSNDWFLNWAETYEVEISSTYTISKNTKSHPGAIVHCVVCPWEDEHTIDGGGKESVVIVDLGGQLNFLCRHSHGSRYGWKEYRSEIESRYEKLHPDHDDQTLYNLSDLLRSIHEGYPVYIVEGERDAAIMRSVLHYTATTSEVWKREYAQFFRGATVTILISNEKTANAIYKDLADYAFKRRIISKISVSEYFDKEGHTPEEFKEILQDEGNKYLLASWAYLNRYDEVNIKPPALAVSFSKITDYIIVRNPIDDNDLYYGYKDGVYSRCNKAQVKSSLREMIPVTYQKDNQITEAYRTIFELGTKIHSFEDLDKDERYINFKNGLYDVRKRELLPHDPEVLSTIQLRYNYDSEARDAPVFKRFIDHLFTKEDGSVDQDSMKILQEFSGLAISNIYVYRAKKALFLCSFRGNTGKTVFMNLLQLILGEENVTSIPIQHMNEGTGRFTMGTAIGKRMIINGDQTESDVGDSSYFKQLTGGDRTKMENKNQKPLMIRYRGGIMIGCNGLPSFSDDKGEHVFERLLLIMCTNVIPEAERDPKLLDKMKPEIPAIINWMLEGLTRLLSNGFKFTRSAASEEATRDYRSQLDTVYRFLQEGRIEAISRYTPFYWRYVVTKDNRDQVSKKDFYNNYQSWCEDPEIDVTPMKKKNLAQRLAALGCEIDRRGTLGDRRGVYTIRGMKYVNNITEDSRIPTDEDLRGYVRKKSAEESAKSPQEGFESFLGPTPYE